MNDIASNAFSSILEPTVKAAAAQIYEKQKTKALKDLEVAFECAKSDIMAKCALEIQQRVSCEAMETEFVIRVKR